MVCGKFNCWCATSQGVCAQHLAVWQDCFIEFINHTLPSRTLPINTEKHNQHGFELDFTCCTFFGKEDDAVCHWEDI